MLEVSWFGFYMLLHVAIALLLVPLLLLFNRLYQLQPMIMLRLWSVAAGVVLVLPMILLQPWALDRQVLPWFHGQVQVLSATPMIRAKPVMDLPERPVATLVDEPQIANSKAPVTPQENNTALASAQLIANSSEDSSVTEYRWPWLSQLLYLLGPGAWLWWLVPLGMVVKGFGFLRRYWVTQEIKRQSMPINAMLTPEQVQSMQQRLHDWLQAHRGQASQQRMPELRVHPHVQSAMLLGFRQPIIMLPSSYLSLCREQELDYILLHEATHWQQHDLPAYLLEQLLGCLLWWSPAWRVFSQELERWRELRCDALVCQRVAEPLAYAQTLLNCAKKQQKVDHAASSTWPFLMQSWLKPSLLTLRVDALLVRQTPRQQWHSWLLIAGLLLASLCLFALAKRWQLADLPAQHAQIGLSQLQPLSELLDAVRQGDLELVAQLIQAGAPLNLAMPGQGSPLMVSASLGDMAMVEQLLALGADVEVSSRGDGNPLIIAAMRGDLLLAERLLKAGANVNAVVLADETPLINASFRGDIAMVELLLAHGADLNLHVETPLSDGPEMRSALSRTRHAEMRNFLLQRGAR